MISFARDLLQLERAIRFSSKELTCQKHSIRDSNSRIKRYLSLRIAEKQGFHPYKACSLRTKISSIEFWHLRHIILGLAMQTGWFHWSGGTTQGESKQRQLGHKKQPLSFDLSQKISLPWVALHPDLLSSWSKIEKPQPNSSIPAWRLGPCPARINWWEISAKRNRWRRKINEDRCLYRSMNATTTSPWS